MGTSRDGRTTRILIATDVRLYSEGLEAVLESQDGFDVAGTVRTAAKVLDRCLELDPDILVLDPAMPDSRSVTRLVFDSKMRVRVIVVGLGQTESEVVLWARQGAAAFVTRESDLDELVETIRAVARGEWSCSPTAMRALLRHMARQARGFARPKRVSYLTQRESEVSELVGRGLSNKEIASELGITVATVKNHVHNILTKLDLRRRGEVAAWLRFRGAPRRPQRYRGYKPSGDHSNGP